MCACSPTTKKELFLTLSASLSYPFCGAATLSWLCACPTIGTLWHTDSWMFIILTVNGFSCHGWKRNTWLASVSMPLTDTGTVVGSYAGPTIHAVIVAYICCAMKYLGYPHCSMFLRSVQLSPSQPSTLGQSQRRLTLSHLPPLAHGGSHITARIVSHSLLASWGHGQFWLCWHVGPSHWPIHWHSPTQSSPCWHGEL